MLRGSRSVLEVNGLTVAYDGEPAVRDVTLRVERGQLLAVLGPNGAGKTTTLRAIMGLLPWVSGSIAYHGVPLGGHPRTAQLVRAGICLVPEGRGLFANLTVRENLMLGAYAAGKLRAAQRRIDDALDLFPALRRRYDTRARLLSGGEQQAVAIVRALAAGPEVLLLDEPSLGLAPKLIVELFDALRAMGERGIALIVVEQNFYAALRVATHACIMDGGVIRRRGTAAEIAADDTSRHYYLPGSDAETQRTL